MADADKVASENRLKLLALCSIEGIHWHVLAREAQREGGLDRLLAAQVSEHSTDGEETRSRLEAGLGTMESRIETAATEVERASAEANASLVTILDEDFPSNLRVVPSPPPFLFYQGRLSRDDTRSVAVVGTRKASEEGLHRAGKLAERLTHHGVTVTSGLARGIDTAAHEATLAHGGRTTAVVGTGILKTYPKENAKLDG